MARIGFIPFFLVFLFSKMHYGSTVALFIFVIASLTDWYDGRLARERNEVTEFGKFLDPIADKLLVFSAFISFVQLELVPTWMIIVMIGREFLITSLRMVAISNGHHVLPAEQSGKHKTAWHIATIITILVIISSQKIFDWRVVLESSGDAGMHLSAFIKTIPYIMTVICAFYSIYSAYDFINKNRGHFFEKPAR
ncbi:MAG: CDP-diacylglycerol--glycerol-3-phosphate 3-phosphatidyltransferase [Candidatus Firestonebacteria bacterium RIFOXYA2_FULL_40_8]|nr:MAG: CDP-diacylglycerol--glycerol-3-phosphate 3-phosphatidyltransferase [Candidatus Firestonebacteria bacterium RIFOXYA2_FULL_40_8]